MTTSPLDPSPPDPSLLHPWPPLDWTPRAVVFDCDGLLVDTEAEWIATQEAFLAAHHVQLDPAVRRRITGASGETVVLALAEATSRPPEGIIEELVALHARLAPEELTLLPGAERTLREAAARVPVAIASNSPRELLDAKIDAMGIGDVLDASVAIEDVEHPKPAPDMYALAARRLGVEPGRALAFEDSETGAQAARAAGLRLIAVPSQEGQDPVADHRLDSLEDARLHAWITTWEGVR